jgi:pectinesterase
MRIQLFIFISLLLLNLNLTHADCIVDCHGHGDFTTITAAINSLPMYPYQRTLIFIKNGIYEEKIRLEQNYITLRGENRDSTIIQFNQLRENWNKNKDAIGPAVVNIQGDDIILDNLTIENTQPEIGPHAFAIYGVGTRTIIMNCNVLSKGGDTVSLWNYKNGMYYHSNCFFQGAVDFVCPRGWCFICDSQFYEVKVTATIWHDGHFNPDQKFVIVNSSFDGVPGFELGRCHYDAQFYLIDCQFSTRLSDHPIYKVQYDDPTKNNPNNWGKRIYFFNCQKQGTLYNWLQNNLDQAIDSLKANPITPDWTFDNQWDPENTKPIKIIDYHITENFLCLTMNEIISIIGEPLFINQSGKLFSIVKQRFTDNNKVTFTSDRKISEDDLAGAFNLQAGKIIASVATVQERPLEQNFRIKLK